MDDGKPPIYSTREDEVELGEAIEAFVIELAERVDQLQDAERAADFGRLLQLAERLGSAAQGLGFTSLGQLARVVARACDEEKADLAQRTLIEITEISRRIRLGHRGAA